MSRRRHDHRYRGAPTQAEFEQLREAFDHWEQLPRDLQQLLAAATLFGLQRKGYQLTNEETGAVEFEATDLDASDMAFLLDRPVIRQRLLAAMADDLGLEA